MGLRRHAQFLSKQGMVFVPTFSVLKLVWSFLVYWLHCLDIPWPICQNRIDLPILWGSSPTY